MKSGANTTCSLVAAKTQKVPIAQCASWLFANRDAKGYYRVAYTKANLNAVGAVAESELNAPERIALIEDAWAMTRVGKTSIGDFLGLAQALRSEQRDLVAINLLSGDSADVGDLLVPENESRDYRDFVHKQFAPRAKELGWVPRANDSDAAEGNARQPLGEFWAAPVIRRQLPPRAHWYRAIYTTRHPSRGPWLPQHSRPLPRTGMQPWTSRSVRRCRKRTPRTSSTPICLPWPNSENPGWQSERSP